jgi:hypothetical protein
MRCCATYRSGLERRRGSVVLSKFEDLGTSMSGGGVLSCTKLLAPGGPELLGIISRLYW